MPVMHEDGTTEFSPAEVARVQGCGVGDGEGPATAGGDPDDDATELYGEPWAGASWPGSPASSTNRQGANRQWVEAGGGEDTADWGWLVEWDEAKLEQWGEKIGRAQKASQAGDWEGSLVRIGAVQALVRPGGSRVGGLYFAWVIEAAGYRLTIMDRVKPFGETPNVRVHVGALALLQSDLVAVRECAQSMVELMGGKVQGEKLSRVDACLDLVDVPVSDFVVPLALGQVVRRGRNMAMYQAGNAWTGFDVGRGCVRLRIYDKVAECQKDAAKWDAMIQMRYGGEVPEIASRVEFQLRRKALKEFGIETIADWIEKRAGVLDYLTGQWFRLTEGKVDRENSQRCGPSSLWQRVSEGFSSWAGQAFPPATRERLKRKLLDVGAYVRQGVGCLTAAAAMRGRSIVTFGDVMRYAEEVLGVFEGEIGKGVVERYQEKRATWDRVFCEACPSG